MRAILGVSPKPQLNCILYVISALVLSGRAVHFRARGQSEQAKAIGRYDADHDATAGEP